MTQHAFFQHYMYGSEVDERGRPRMLKVKDWPPDEHFRVRMVRHNQVRRRRGCSVQQNWEGGEHFHRAWPGSVIRPGPPFSHMLYHPFLSGLPGDVTPACVHPPALGAPQPRHHDPRLGQPLGPGPQDIHRQRAGAQHWRKACCDGTAVMVMAASSRWAPASCSASIPAGGGACGCGGGQRDQAAPGHE